MEIKTKKLAHISRQFPIQSSLSSGTRGFIKTVPCKLNTNGCVWYGIFKYNICITEGTGRQVIILSQGRQYHTDSY